MKRLMMVVVLLMAVFALTFCATGDEESGTATQSALRATDDAGLTATAAAVAVIQATSDAASAAQTQVVADAQATADAASTTAASQPTDEPTVPPTDVPATVVPPTEVPTEVPATDVPATEVPTEVPATDVPATEVPTEVPATDVPATDVPATDVPTEAPTEEPTADANALATTEARQARATQRAEDAAAATAAAAEPTAEPATEEPTAEPTTEAATEEPTEEAATVEPTTEVAATTAPDTGVTSVCLVTDLGRINDGSFNQSAYEGMERAGADFGLTTKYIETQAQTDYEANINTCVDEGFDIVVTVGFLIYDATIAAAKANPDVMFIGVDEFPAEAVANFAGIQFREDQSGFLAGVMAALMSESGKIGGVYGIEIPPVVKFRNGFEQGAKYINPDIEVYGVYIPDFVAPQLGAEAANAFVTEQGVDVVFGAGGPTGSGGITRAAELGAWVIGVDKDEYLTNFGAGEAPNADKIITSAMKRVDQGVYDMIEAVVNGDGFPEGSLYLMDAAVNGIGFAPAHDAAVPEEVTAQVQAVFELLASGELETGVDPVTGALLETTEPVATDAAAEPTAEPVVEATATP